MNDAEMNAIAEMRDILNSIANEAHTLEEAIEMANEGIEAGKVFDIED